MIETNENAGLQVEWNMANMLNLELARLRTSANTAFISGEFKKAVDSLNAMLMTAIHVLNDAERSQVTELENQLNPLLMQYGYTGWEKNQIIISLKARMDLRKLYPKYNMLIMDLLDKYGFLGSRKQDASKMKR